MVNSDENIYIYFYCLFNFFGHVQIPDKVSIFIFLSKLGERRVKKFNRSLKFDQRFNNNFLAVEANFLSWRVAIENASQFNLINIRLPLVDISAKNFNVYCFLPYGN